MGEALDGAVANNEIAIHEEVGFYHFMTGPIIKCSYTVRESLCRQMI